MVKRGLDLWAEPPRIKFGLSPELMHLWRAWVLSSRGLISPGDNRNIPLNALRTTWICVSRPGYFFLIKEKNVCVKTLNAAFFIIISAHTDNPLL